MCFAPQRRHFLNFSSSKSDLNVVCFGHFDFEMCFGPQRRALISTSQLPKSGSTWCGLHILTSKWVSRHNGVRFFEISTSKSGLRMVCFVHFLSKCASRHNSVQVFISHLARWLRTRRFSEPTFRPSGATNQLEKRSASQLFYLFPHLHLLSSDSFSSLIFSLLLFSSLPLPASCFSI